MAEHYTNLKNLSARDEQYRQQMRNASDALLYALLRELEGRGRG